MKNQYLTEESCLELYAAVDEKPARSKPIAPQKRVLTDAQYQAMSAMFNECNEAFHEMSLDWQGAFYDRLYGHIARPGY